MFVNYKDKILINKRIVISMLAISAFLLYIFMFHHKVISISLPDPPETIHSHNSGNVLWFILTTNTSLEGNVVRNNLSHICYNDRCMIRESTTLSAEMYRLDYIRTLKLISSVQWNYAVILEDDYKLCSSIDLIEDMILLNKRLAYQLSYGSVAIAYSREYLPTVISILEISKLPVDNSLGMNALISKTKMPLIVEDRSRRLSTMGHVGTSGLCNQPCIDSSLMRYQFEECSVDLSPCDSSTTNFLRPMVFYRELPACVNNEWKWLSNEYDWSVDLGIFARDVLRVNSKKDHKVHGEFQKRLFTIWFGPIDKYLRIIDHNCKIFEKIDVYSNSHVNYSCVNTIIIDVGHELLAAIKDPQLVNQLVNSFKNNDGNTVTHVSDILRIHFADENSIYFDMDFMFLNKNILKHHHFFIINKKLHDENFYVPNGMFSIKHREREILLNSMIQNYNENCWDCVGPRLFKMLLIDNEVVKRYEFLDWEIIGGQKVETHHLLYTPENSVLRDLVSRMIRINYSIHIGRIYLDKINVKGSIIHNLLVEKG